MTIITGKALERHIELHTLQFEFHKLFNYDEKNYRAIAIVGVTFLDILLESILRAFLADEENEVKELLRYGQPLGSFSAKITMADCLGLIYKPVRDDLHLVRKIRNQFAHELDVSFEDRKIQSWCNGLKWHRIAYVADPPEDATAQGLFQVGVNQLITYLNGVVGIARGEKRKISRYE